MNDWFDRLTHHWNSFYTCLAEVRTKPNMLYLCPGIPEMPLICNQKKGSSKTTRQDSPEKKTQQNQKNKSHKNNLDEVWLFCVFLVCFFSVCSGFVFFKPLYSLCCSAQKPGIQKGSKQTPYSNFWLERKRRVKNVWKEGGTGPTLLRIHFLNFWVRYD